jgi:3-hydroxyacyl-[acyl-carrier-protein] dehydratase
MTVTEIKLPIGIEEIKKSIPHRFPFLLVDEVVSFTKDELIVANKKISPEEPVLAGHFPGNPIWPGVYLVEGMAQASAILIQLSRGKPTETCLLVEVEKSRFKIPVVPGDLLSYEIKLIKQKGPFYWFEGKAQTANGIVALASFSAKFL